MMTKFNVGDDVRVIGKGAAGLAMGTIAEVVHVDCDGDVNLDNGTFYLKENIELLPTTDRRLTEAEAKIATLEAEVKALKGASKPTTIVVNSCFAKVSEDADIGRIASALFERMAPRGHSKSRYMEEVAKASITPNQRRADVIKRAQAYIGKYDSRGNFTGREGFRAPNGIISDTDFIVNVEKRTVVCLLRAQCNKDVQAKAVAKCAPDDVFNADICKAIALGGALGLDVSEFENAVKPTEVVVGMVVNNSYVHAAENGWGVGKVKTLDGGTGYRVEDGSWSFVRSAIITDDTDAVYL